jgi:hypothetical protein
VLHVEEELLASLFSSCPCEEVSVTIHVAGSDGCSEFSETLHCHVNTSDVPSCDNCHFFLTTNY